MVIFLKLENNKFSKSKIYLFPKTVFKKKKNCSFSAFGNYVLKTYPNWQYFKTSSTK